MADPTTLDLLETLIAFDTTTTRSNAVMAEYCRAYLEARGARVRQDWNADGTKVNLFATLGEGPGGLVLSGHMDVVSVEGQDWSSDPFRAEVRDGRLYGRGACDMKGFVAAALAQVPKIARRAAGAPVHVALTYDEEQGCLGIPHLIADLERAGIRPSACLVGEPTSMAPVAAHKGGRVLRTTVTGVAAHASLKPFAVNAIEVAARLIAFMTDVAEREARWGPRDEAFAVPFSTLSTNLVAGGVGPNIVPAAAVLTTEIRTIPGVAASAFGEAIEAFARDVLIPRSRTGPHEASIAFEVLADIPALATREDAPFRRLVESLAGRPAGKVAFGTEAGFFERFGVATMVLGPGSIEQAHKPDEFVPVAELHACDAFLDALVEAFA